MVHASVDLTEIPTDFKKSVIENTRQYIRDKHAVQKKRPSIEQIKKQDDDIIDVTPELEKVKVKAKEKIKERIRRIRRQ